MYRTQKPPDSHSVFGCGCISDSSASERPLVRIAVRLIVEIRCGIPLYRSEHLLPEDAIKDEDRLVLVMMIIHYLLCC